MSEALADLGPWPRRGRQWMLLWLLLWAAAATQIRLVLPSQPLSMSVDRDGFFKLQGVGEAQTLGQALRWFWGDDPQKVHTFRPLPALTLWCEYQLWGSRRWPYLVVNAGWAALVVVLLLPLLRRWQVPPAWSYAVLLVAAARPTRGSLAVIGSVACRHDLTCTAAALAWLLLLLCWLDSGRRAALWGLLPTGLAAYLSKEMALALVPLGLFVAATCWRQTTPRRALSAQAVSLALALVWYVWYRYAQTNMAGGYDSAHGFAGLLKLLLERSPGTTVQQACYNLAYWPADTARILYAAGGSAFCSAIFYRALAKALLTCYGLLLLWRHDRPALLLIYAWKTAAYLPILPLHDIWGWYEYMPQVLDPLLVWLGGRALWHHGGGRLAWQRWAGRLAAERRLNPPPGDTS
ncbi:MAG: hypothetical protein IT204_01920 [Fimbriimonadaceae bacterium]|nr:hypothetical protein [Fimbriimonadaceae bacterium]